MDATRIETVATQFQGIYQLEDRVSEFKEQIKALNKSAKEMKKAIAEELELSDKSVERAYKNWVFSVENPGVYDESETLVEQVKDVMNRKKIQEEANN